MQISSLKVIERSETVNNFPLTLQILMQKTYKFEEAYKKPIPWKKYINFRNFFVNYLKMNN